MILVKFVLLVSVQTISIWGFKGVSSPKHINSVIIYSHPHCLILLCARVCVCVCVCVCMCFQTQKVILVKFVLLVSVHTISVNGA